MTTCLRKALNKLNLLTYLLNWMKTKKSKKMKSRRKSFFVKLGCVSKSVKIKVLFGRFLFTMKHLNGINLSGILF